MFYFKGVRCNCAKGQTYLALKQGQLRAQVPETNARVTATACKLPPIRTKTYLREGVINSEFCLSKTVSFDSN